MQSKPNLLFIGMLAVYALVGIPSARAETVKPPANEYYLIDFDYKREEAYPGNRNLLLTITMKTPVGVMVPDDQALSLAKIEWLDDSKVDISQQTDDPNGVVEKYVTETLTYLLKLPDTIEPRNYRLKLRFKFSKYGDKPTVDRLVDLSVGPRSMGRLKVIPAEAGLEPFVAGSDATFELRLKNEYSDYPINIHKVTLSSAPYGLAKMMSASEVNDSKAEINHDTNTITFKPALTLKPFQQLSVPLGIRLRHMSFSNWIAGFGETSKLIFRFEYDDNNERTITDYSPEALIKVRPSDWTLLGAMLIGVAIGTGLKFYLEYLREKGAINRKGVAMFVFVTIVVGVVITIFAWAGQIQIIAFKNVNLSYDRPAVIFILGLIGALGGVHYLNNWAQKLLEQKA